ncbi:MAG: hypothetical protein M1840_007007 [Geoglossum simile]|nr:MAG: hypothetical protein M1840_007007 [Geoglossum simile]
MAAQEGDSGGGKRIDAYRWSEGEGVAAAAATRRSLQSVARAMANVAAASRNEVDVSEGGHTGPGGLHLPPPPRPQGLCHYFAQSATHESSPTMQPSATFIIPDCLINPIDPPAMTTSRMTEFSLDVDPPPKPKRRVVPILQLQLLEKILPHQGDIVFNRLPQPVESPFPTRRLKPMGDILPAAQGIQPEHSHEPRVSAGGNPL